MTSTAIDMAADDMAHELLARGESIQFIARGHSMWPHVLDGDTVCVAPIDTPLKMGDVVLIPHPGLGRLHRVVELSSSGWVRVRGDALILSDGWFAPHELAGCLQTITRNGRKINAANGRFTVIFSTILGYARRVVSLLK